MALSNDEIKLVIQGIWNVTNKVAERINSSNKKYKELKDRFNFIENVIIRKNEDIKHLEEIVKKNEDTINEKNNKIALQYSEIEKFEKQKIIFSDLETNYIKIINENSNLRFELENIGKNNIELEILKKEHSELFIQYKELKINYDVTAEKLKLLEKNQKDLEITQRELVNYKHEIINRNEQINKLKIALSEQQNININFTKKNKQLEENNILNMNEIEKLQNEINLLTEKNILLEQEIEQISFTKSSELLDYIAKYENIKNEINYYYNTKFNNENNIKELEQKLLEKDHNLLNQLENYQKIIESIKEENENNIKINNELTIKYNNEIEKLESEVNNFRDRLVSLTIENREYLEKIDELQQHLLSSGSNEFIENENNEVAELITENNKLTDIIAELKDELDSNKAGFKHLTNENNKLQLEINNNKKENEKLSKLSKIIEELKKNNKELGNQNDNLHKELKSYKKRIYDENSLFADSHKLQYENIIADYKNQIEKLVDENKQLQLEINNSENKNAKEKVLQNKPQKDELVNKINNFLTKLESKI